MPLSPETLDWLRENDTSLNLVIEGAGNLVSETSKILDSRAELTGTNREKLLSTIQNEKLRILANQLYRPGATMGDGGSASALVEEFLAGDSTHLIKAKQRLINLDRISLNETLSLDDWDILEALREDLQQAINLFN